MIGGIDAPAPVVPLVTGQGHFVGIVPKVILQGGVFRGRCNPIESCLYPMQAGIGHHTIVQREGSRMKRVVGMGVGGNIARSQILIVVCRRALLQAVHIHCERIGALGIPYREMQVQRVLAKIAQGVQRVAHRERRAVEMLAHTIVAVACRGGKNAWGRGKRSRAFERSSVLGRQEEKAARERAASFFL